MASSCSASSRLRRDKRGIAATEMALVAPFLAFFMVIGVDFGRATSQSIELTHALRAGAQHSLTALGSKQLIENTIKDSLPEHLKATAAITATCYCGVVAADSTALPAEASCDAQCPATSAKMMTLRAEHAFTPYNIVLGNGMATAFGFNKVVGNVTIRHW